VRYLKQYRYPYQWIAGWWDSYYGWMPHVTPLPLHKARPFHHPWLQVNETDSPLPLKGEQRKPIIDKIMRHWWQVTLAPHDEKPWPEVDIRTLMLANQPTVTFSVLEPIDLAPFARSVSPVGQALLGLPLDTLAGLSRRGSAEGVAAWAITAARWVDQHAQDEIDLSDAGQVLHALYCFKQEATIYGDLAIPRTTKGL
jgi:hypothetical protein